MSRRSAFRLDERGVNTSVGYVIALGITTVLISLLILSASSFVSSHQSSVVDEEMDLVGQTTANHLMDVDRMIRRGNDPTVRRTVRLPDSLANAQYTMEIDDSVGGANMYAVRLRTNNPVAEKRIRFRSQTDVEGTVTGGNIVIEYDGDTMVMKNAG